MQLVPYVDAGVIFSSETFRFLGCSQMEAKQVQYLCDCKSAISRSNQSYS